jgi:hypothetical protein
MKHVIETGDQQILQYGKKKWHHLDGCS